MATKRGRPIGHKLSAKSRKAISESKMGQQHSQETKDKISKSLVIYFRKLNTISDEITNRYCRVGDDYTCDWVNNVREDLDDTEGLVTDKSLRNKRRTEVCYGNNIEYFSHELTPETIVMFMQYCEQLGLTPEDAFDKLED